MPEITSFRGAYAFLSNFYSAKVMYEGDEYPTVEHAFQAAKTTDLKQRLAVKNAATPGEAKRLGSQVTLRPDWNKVKTDIMYNLLVQKFRNSENGLADKLLTTGKDALIEGNTWGDKYWGCVLENGKWVGANQLGKSLMKIRSAIRQELRE